MKRLYILTFFSIISSFIIWGCKGLQHSTVPYGKGLVIDKNWLANTEPILTPEKDRRPADQTYLTFPEWFLVYSPAEQANYFKSHTATSFPYLTHVKQIWGSYRIVKDQIRGNYKYNFGYNAMIKVISISTTVEYAYKSLYENTIGRMTDPEDVAELTAEDKFYADYMQDYVAFIKVRPWYEFDFSSRLPKLWKTPLLGNHFLRKYERKIYLSADLVIKTVYGEIIKIGSKSAYGEALPTTVVLVSKRPTLSAKELPNMHIEKVYSDSSVLLSLPRYDEFNFYATKLALNGISFREIAGNNCAILVTVLLPSKADFHFDNAQPVFTQVISSEPTMKRVAIAAPVKALSTLLTQLNKDSVEVEHVYDF